VGDVKQAIFAWRGGDPRAVSRDASIAADNTMEPGRVVEGRLDVSVALRSGGDGDMVNRVFGAKAELRELVPAAADAWERVAGAYVRAAAIERLGGAAPSGG